MKTYLLLIASLAAPALSAGITSPGADGDMARAIEMYSLGNYNGVLDQLRDAAPAVPQIDLLQLRAKTLFALGDYNAAAADFAALAALCPASPDYAEALVGRADCLYALGRAQEAFEAYEEVPVQWLNPEKEAVTTFRRGVCALETDGPDAAVPYFEKAARNGATRSQAQYYLGVIDFDKGNYSAAEQHFAHVSTHTDYGVRVPWYMAQIYFAQAQWGKALSQARSVLNGCPAELKPEMLRVAGESLCRLGRESEGLDELRQYVKSTDTPALSALYLLGTDQYRQGNYEEALQLLTPVASGGDNIMKQSAYLFIGQALMNTGDNNAAILAFDKAVDITDGDPAVEEAAYYNYAVAKFSGASVPFSSAAETFEAFLKRYPHGTYATRVSEYLAGAYLADNDYERALERIRRSESTSRKMLVTKQKALYGLAWNNLQNHNYDTASTLLAEAATIKADAATSAETALLQGIVESSKGNYGSAEKFIEQYLRQAADSKNKPTAYYRLGYALYSQGKNKEAANAFERASQMLEGTYKADALARLADLAQVEGNFSEAARRYNLALAADGACDYAAFQLAKIKGYQRDYKGKLEALRHFQRQFPQSSLMPDALLEITQAQISLGQSKDAIDTYGTLIADFPGTAQGRRAYNEMAMTLLDAGRREEALQAYRSVISLYPTSEEAAQASGILKNLYTDAGEADKYLSFIRSIDNAPVIDEASAEEIAAQSALNALQNSGSTQQIEAFTANYKDSPRRAEFLSILMERCSAQNDTECARRYAAELLARYPDSRHAEGAMALEATNLYSLGHTPESLEMWQALAARASNASMSARAALGAMRAARDLGDYALAAQKADELMNANLPESERFSLAEAKFTKACALEADDKTDEAIELWQSLAANPAEEFGAKSAFRAAEALFESGKTAAARKLAQKFVQSGSQHRYWVARGFILLSDIYKAEGKTFEAREYLEALRDNYPGDEADIFMMIDTRLNDK